MAIDDNTSYELTGAQVKDLASKIKAKADSSSLATVATSGSYTDLINTPTIPTVNDATLTITQNGTSAGTFTANASSNATIALTDTTYSAMTGATSSTAGASGLVPAPAAGDENKVLSGAGTWVNQSGGGASTVTYYANSTSTAGFQSGAINGPYIYKDSARATIATPREIYDNFQAGNSIHIEYESTQTGPAAFAMTLEVATMSFNGSNVYSMILNEVNEETQGDPRDLAMLRLYAYWDGQSTFSSRWVLQRKYVNDGTLTIQQNGTTVGTFTANQSGNTTVNLAGGIYADDPTAPANPNAWITPSDIDWSAFTDGSTYFTIGSLLIQFGTEDFGNQSYSSGFWGSTNRSANQNLYVTFPKAFSAKPYYVGIQPVGSTQMAIAYAAGSTDDSATRSRDFAVLVPSSQTGTLSTKVQWIAIGPV